MEASRVILFDGYCNLCNGLVQFVIQRDPKGKFQFAPLSSDFARTRLNANTLDTDSIVLLDHNQVYTKSKAALRIAGQLKGWCRLLPVFLVVPPFIRDWIYDLIARNRYGWFGQRKTCMVPTEANKQRFIDGQ